MAAILQRLFFPNASLCKRLSFGLSFMLVPLVLVVLATFVSQNMIIDQLTDIAEEFTEEIAPVLRIHQTLHEVMMPVHDYLIHGNQERELKRFRDLAFRVDEAFANALDGPFRLESESEKVRAAFLSWQAVRMLGEKILYLPVGPGNPEGMRAMEYFDLQIEQTLAPIENFYHDANREILLAEAEVAEIKLKTRLFVALMLAAGLGTALISGVVLSRSILRPMQVLRKGVNRLQAGDLLHRVDLPARDEFGMLASAFNHMAQELEKNHRSLEELAVRDELTGLYNRRRFVSDLSSEIVRTGRYGNPFALLLIDIDHFKSINDTFGHSAGDTVLQQLSTCLREDLRECDTIFRIGGEEFAIILPQVSEGAALEIADRIRRTVAEKVLGPAPSRAQSITVSIGVSLFPAFAGDSDSLFLSADQALYQAKEEGRNRVCLARHDDSGQDAVRKGPKI